MILLICAALLSPGNGFHVYLLRIYVQLYIQRPMIWDQCAVYVPYNPHYPMKQREALEACH
jgi:hypothetical protein